MKLRFASPHFVYSSPRVFWLELYCFGAKNLSLKKPIRNGRSFALLCKRPGAVIKQITLNNLPWQPSNVGKKKKKDSEDWCKKNKIKKTVVEMRRNTKWEEGDLREEVLQGSIYTYPRRAGAAGGTRASLLQGRDTVVLSSYSIRRGLNGSEAALALTDRRCCVVLYYISRVQLSHVTVTASVSAWWIISLARAPHVAAVILDKLWLHQ